MEVTKKKETAYRSHLTNYNYMPYNYQKFFRNGNDTHKIGYYVFIYAYFSVC